MDIEGYREIGIKEKKEVLLSILIEFDSFCRANGITYFLAGGTLLGAIRHHGFIPWDDDVDVVMLREEYDKYIRMYKNTSKYELKCFENDDEYVYPFAKLIDRETLLIEDVQNPQEIGLYLDIFPLDNCPGGYKEACTFLKRVLIYRYIRIFKEISCSRSWSILKKVIYYVCRAIVAPIPLKVITEKIIIMSKKYQYDKSEYVGQLTHNVYGIRELYKKEVFCNIEEREFEGYNFYVPIEYDCYLRTTYGNYLELPPVEQQKTHHSNRCWIKQ